MPCISAMHPVKCISYNTEVHNPAGHAIRQKQKALWFHGVVVSVQHASHRILEAETF